MVVFDDLEAEQDRLEEILSGLSEPDWASSSAAADWTIADVVLHLAQSEEAVVASVAGADLRARQTDAGARVADGITVDQLMDDLVRAQRAAPASIFQRWRTARRDAVAALRAADPDKRLQWVDAPLKPRTLATTRLAEHWAHGLDITGPLGIDFPDTQRLRHVAWLAHRTLPYALALAGQQPHEVFCELTAPDGVTTWRFGPPDAGSSITGPAGAFCRVAAQRIPPDRSGMRTAGPYADTALRVLRTYAA
ncbi:MAG: maleylpyruvate isomerase family mycothiol-dependent enzyme [Micromonosporaceae bacterium]